MLTKTNSGQVDVKIIILLACILVFTIFFGMLVIKISGELIIAGVIGFALIVTCFLSVRVALYTLIFSMLLSPEFGSRSTEGGGVTIRLEDFLLIVIAFGWFARAAIFKELGLLKKTPLNRPILFYILACVVSTAFGMMYGRVQFVKGFFFVLKYIEYFIVYFIAVNYLNTRKQARNLIIGLLIVFVVVCFTSMAQIPQGERITAPFEGEGGEPNTLGGYLLLILSVVAGLLLNTDRKDPNKYKFLLFIMCFLAIIPILFSQSRGTWTAAVPCYLTFLLVSNKKVILSIFLVLTLVIGPFVIPATIKERFMYTFKKQPGWVSQFQEKVGGVTFDTATSERISSYKRAFEAYFRHPVFGYGITGWRFLDAQYMKTLVETGALGLISFGMLLYAILRETKKAYKCTDDKFLKGVAMGAYAGVLAMILHATGANTFIIVRIMEPFWFLMAIVIVIPQIVAAEKLKETEEAKSPLVEKNIKPAFKSSPFVLRR